MAQMKVPGLIKGLGVTFRTMLAPKVTGTLNLPAGPETPEG